ncbi:hypothetical protein [Acidithiobacillus caldus]|uniref:hypothetical protein n=1 Tax=Acidithiobacillus caldus TaxID=33059 RepID=UPI00068EE21B|nr:hypothetical protein [Acidithiobacillus caldus]MBU2729813.1 hypothetical protein [Acidithiobacillus caldus]MBU2736397.1 hypothetical protein [Acidithiobacillus caldus ATCC 51756]MBU2743974.1 hypothetical protein [Acidithiobacillus caldus]MBU2779653.1 hypothetical protein [Acidithiobacillus caldus]
MNAHIYLSGEELQALEGMPHIVFRLYLCLKQFMDFKTGIVGASQRISWMTLRTMLYVQEHQGFEETGTPSLGKVRRAMEWLKRQGLVEDIGSKKRGEAIVFKLSLAPTDFSVQNKPGKNPARTRQGNPEQSKFDENPDNSMSNETSAKKHGKNPASKKSKNPADINNQYSILLPIGNIDPVSNNHGSLGNKHLSSFASPSAQPLPVAEQVRMVFVHWQKTMNCPKAKLDNKRKTRIEWGLKTYDLDSCIAAIDGCARSKWHMGQNDRGLKYNDITLIFRDSEKFERFLAMNHSENKTENGISNTLSRWMGKEPIDGVVLNRAVGEK